MRIAVIGAGAAGFFGAISAATRDSSAEIVIFETTLEPLAKVRISGGGRCNVTHHCFEPAKLVKNYPRGHKELRGPFSRFQPRDTVAWFKKYDVNLQAEDDGRMFPDTNSSATIVDCLMDVATNLGVQLRLDTRVRSIKCIESDSLAPKYEIELPSGDSERFDRVLLATGGSPQGHQLAESLGVTIVPGVPSLFTFKINDPRLDGLSGTSFDNIKLTIPLEGKKKIEQVGPMLITHWGLSGPAILKLSSWGARELHQNKYQTSLKINLVPSLSSDQLTQHLRNYKKQNGKKRVLSGTDLPVPRRYWSRIAQKAGAVEKTTWTNLTRAAMTAIISELTCAQFTICGKGIFKDEFVTCGGVNLKDVDFRTMQVKASPGLYLAGELLDIDGITGGFNFQNAWTTGWIAGMSAAS